ncbi:MAG TPA: hypothetical protein V6D08_01130, partial [Candidatus Obscuribacterales bacterium]
MDASCLQDVSKIKVSRGATAVINFANADTVNLSGSLVNKGRVFAISTDQAVTTAAIAALNIRNGRNAVISSILPADVLATINSSLVSDLNLTLSAVRTIINAGTISSAGNLTLAAGTSIINASPTGMATIQGASNVNLITNNLINSGFINSTLANINIASQTIANMTISNTRGVLEALQGAINVLGKGVASNLHILGGDIVARTLNVKAGLGDIDINVDKLEGSVNLEALNAHVLTATDTLRLGTLKIAGDPYFYNSAGDIDLTGDLVFYGEPLSLIASGDVTGSGFMLDTSSGTGDGGDIFICAGCAVTPVGSAMPPQPALSPPSLALTGGSVTGGNIDLSNYTVKTVSTQAGGSGGDILMLAFEGNRSGTGKVLFNGSIASGGTGTGANGNVTAVAGRSAGAALELVGPVDTNGGEGGGGNVNLVTAQPIATGTVLPNGQFVPATFGWGIINGNARAAIGSQTARSQLWTAGNLTINAGNIDLYRDTTITSKRNVTLAAINNVIVGDEDSGQKP